MKKTLKSIWEKLPDFVRNPNPNVYRDWKRILVVDLETTNLDKGSPYNPENRVVLACWMEVTRDLSGRIHTRVTSRRASEFELGELIGALRRCEFWVAHNAKFELGWFVRCGLGLREAVQFCTQIAEYNIQGNRRPGLSLNACLERYGLGQKESTVSKLIKSGVCPSEIPKRWLSTYCHRDVEATWRLFLRQSNYLDSNGMFSICYTANLFTPVVVDLESTGIHLDESRVRSIATKLNKELQELQVEWDKIATIPEQIKGNPHPTAAVLSGEHPVNVKSPKQMRQLLYDKLKLPYPKDYRGNPVLTPSGEVTTGLPHVTTLKAKNKKQERVLTLLKRIAYIRDQKSKAIDKYLECLEDDTTNGILYANINQTVTQTHRLSSSGRKFKAQFQNFPRQFKPTFCSRKEGWKIGEVDLSQLEYRVAVDLADDEEGRSDIQNRVDAHQFTASIIGCNRQDAKAHTFKPLYGGSSGTTEEKRYYVAFKEKHKGIAELQEQWKKEVLDQGKLKTITGLTFYWPDTHITRSGYITNSTSICNYPIQYLATGEIVPVGLIYQWHMMKAADMQSFLINTVHDSSIVEVHPEEEELFKEIASVSYTKIPKWYLKKVYNYDFTTPLDVDINIETHWNTSDKWEKKWLN